MSRSRRTGRANDDGAAIPTNIKRPLYPDDYLVVLGKSESTGDLTYLVQFEQDW